MAILVLFIFTGTGLLTRPVEASKSNALFQSTSPDDACYQRFLRNNRQNRTLFLDHGLQAGPITALQTSLGFRFWERSMLMLTYQLGRQEYDSDYMIPTCRECIFNFHGLWLGYGFELVKPLSFGTGLFLNPIIQGGSEFVANRGLLPWSNSRFLLNPALRPEIAVGYYRRKIDIYVGLNYTYWLPNAMTSRGNALVDEQTGETLEWDRQLFPGRRGLNGFAGVRYTIF